MSKTEPFSSLFCYNIKSTYPLCFINDEKEIQQSFALHGRPSEYRKINKGK